MFIKNINAQYLIPNYRGSVKEPINLNFQNINYILGPNNSGKTKILDTIHAFLTYLAGEGSRYVNYDVLKRNLSIDSNNEVPLFSVELTKKEEDDLKDLSNIHILRPLDSPPRIICLADTIPEKPDERKYFESYFPNINTTITELFLQEALC